jgi:hypothetical protein
MAKPNRKAVNYMVSKIWLVNAVLALFVAFFGLKAYEVWFQENMEMKLPEMTQKPGFAC